MYILGRTQMIPASTYEEAIKRIMMKGFDGVEIGIYDRNFEIREEFFEKGFAQRMKKIMIEHSVKVCSVGAHMNYTEDEKFNAVSRAIPIAKELGSELIIINGAIKNNNESFDYQWKRQIESTKRLSKVAEQYGVFLAMEFEPDFVIDNTELMLKAFHEIDSPMMKVNADIGHMFLQDPDPMRAIEKCGEYIIHCHVENMEKGIHNHIVPYKGDMNLPQYIEKLRSVGFDGPASLDVYQYDYEEIAEKSVQYLKSII